MSKINLFHTALESVADTLNNCELDVVWHDREVSTHPFQTGRILVDGEPSNLVIHRYDNGEWCLASKAFHAYNNRVTLHEYLLVTTHDVPAATESFTAQLEHLLLAGLAPYA